MRSVADLFDPRSNSIGFIRWLLAFMVIFSHAGPLGNFYGGRDLGTQWSEEQSFGGVAVAGFFFFSGFLITKSRLGRSTTARYFWRRVLRIMPAFWTTFLFTAFVLGPIAFMREEGTLSGYFTAQEDSPFTYISNNLFLILNQPNIAGSATAFRTAPPGTGRRGPSRTSSAPTSQWECSVRSAPFGTASWERSSPSR